MVQLEGRITTMAGPLHRVLQQPPAAECQLDPVTQRMLYAIAQQRGEPMSVLAAELAMETVEWRRAADASRNVPVSELFIRGTTLMPSKTVPARSKLAQVMYSYDDCGCVQYPDESLVRLCGRGGGDTNAALGLDDHGVMWLVTTQQIEKFCPIVLNTSS